MQTGNPSSPAEHWVIVTGWLTMGGAERQALRFAEALLGRGHRVTFVGLSSPGIVQEECARLGIPCHHWPLEMLGRRRRRIVADLWRFWRFLRGLRPTYLAPYCMPPNVACGVVWRWTGARACVWQQRDEGRLRQPRFLERLAVRWMPAFISNSSHACDWMVDTLGVDRRRTRVVRNGIVPPSPSIARNSWRARHGVPGGRLLAVMVANLHSFKDHATLVRAWELAVRGTPPSARPLLVLAGKHHDAFPAVKEFIHRQGLEDCVLCPGVVRDVPELLADADMVVFSSLTEGCPNGVLEGMAAGLPVAATDIPAIREAVGPGGVALLSPPGDAAAMAAGIRRLLDDAGLRREQGALNRRRIAEEFSVERMAAETRAVFEAAACRALP